jgi:hypothetical protein
MVKTISLYKSIKLARYKKGFVVFYAPEAHIM